jgi:hypothetical protein
MADVCAMLRPGLRVQVATGALSLTESHERLEAKEQGRRRSVKAVSRRSRSRGARALTDLRWSGSGAPSDHGSDRIPFRNGLVQDRLNGNVAPARKRGGDPSTKGRQDKSAAFGSGACGWLA